MDHFEAIRAAVIPLVSCIFLVVWYAKSAESSAVIAKTLGVDLLPSCIIVYLIFIGLGANLGYVFDIWPNRIVHFWPTISLTGFFVGWFVFVKSSLDDD